MKKNKPRSGTIPVTWAVCPNFECASRNWKIWDVDFEADAFSCGTCQLKIGKPLFTSLNDISCPLFESTCPLNKYNRPKKTRDF